jgi:hypothetical protein
MSLRRGDASAVRGEAKASRKGFRAVGEVALIETLEMRQLLSASLGVQPGIPSNPTPATGASLTAAQGVLDWADTPNAQRYDVQQDGVDLGITPVSQINLPSVPADGTHNWFVTAINAAGTVTGPTWTYTVDSTAPVVSGFNAPNVVDGGGATYTFTVTYSDNTAIKLSTLATGNVIVTGGGFTTTTTTFPGSTQNGFTTLPQTFSTQTPNFQEVARFVSASTTTDATPITATYAIDAPAGGAFPLGVYTIAINNPQPTFTIDPITRAITTVAATGTPVTDIAGNAVPIQRITQFEISNTPPTVSVSAPPVTTPGATGADFTVTYTAPTTDPTTGVSLDTSRFIVGTTGDINVVTPSGRVIPAVISAVSDPIDITTGLVSTAVVTYHIDAPSGVFTSADNGNYAIVLQQQRIGDTAGISNFAPAGTIGTLVVNVPTLVGFTQTSQNILETSTTPAVLTVTRSGSLASALTVSYTVSGSAIAGVNFVALTGTVTIPAGAVSADIDVQPILTTTFTADKVLTVTLVPQAGVASNGNDTDTLTITEVPPPVVTAANVSGNEPLFGTPGNMVFTIALSKAWGVPVSVPVSTSNGTAVAGVNYVSTQQTVTFAVGQTTATVSVPLIGDLQNKANLTLFLNIGVPTNATQGNSRAIGTIINLPLRTVGFNSSRSANYLDTFGNAVTVSLSGPGSGTLIFRGDTRQPTDALELVTRGTTGKSVVSVSSKKQTTIKIISVGDLSALSAGAFAVTSSVQVNGTVKSVALGSLQNANVSFGQAFAAPAITIGAVQNSSITSQVPIKSLTVVKWVDNDGVADVISAPSIDSLKSSQNFSADVTVDGNLGPVTIGGALTGAKISAGGDIGDVTVNNVVGSTITAGGQLSSFTVKSKFGNAYQRTTIRAAAINSAALGAINPNNNGVQFGIFTASIVSLSGRLPASGPFNFNNPVIVDNTPLESEGDFVILIQGG